MKINRDQLLTALEVVRPGLANKEGMIEQSTAFAFIEGRVVTYNDEISISHPLPGAELTGAIDASTLYDFLKKVKTKEITAEISDNELLIHAKRSKAGLTLQKEVHLPLEELGDVGKWKKLPEGFIEALRLVISSAGRDNNRPNLTCIHVREDGWVEASDSHQATRQQLQEKMPVGTFLLPASAAQELLKIDPKEIAEGDGWIHFRNAETVFSGRVFFDEYPNMDPFMNFEGGTEIILPEDMKEALERAGVFTTKVMGGETPVTITIGSGAVMVESKSETGWIQERLKAGYEGEPLHFSISISLLQRVLDETRECVVGDRAMRFEGERWQHLAILTYIKK